MFSITPIFLIPKRFRNEEYGFFTEVASSTLLLLTGLVLSHLISNLEDGVLPSGVWLFRFLGHHGFVCPFCGATRAFFLCCRFDFLPAMHCSLLGVCFFIWIVWTLPVRCCYLMKKRPCRETWLNRFEYSFMPLAVTVVLFLIQLFLHYKLDWYWIPLQQL